MFSFRRNIARVFGGKNQPLNSSNGVLRCKNSLSQNNCLFYAISPFLKFTGKKITWAKERQFHRLSNQRAEKLKFNFLKWHVKTYGKNSLHEPFGKGGFNSAYLMDLETFMH